MQVELNTLQPVLSQHFTDLQGKGQLTSLSWLEVWNDQAKSWTITCKSAGFLYLPYFSKISMNFDDPKLTGQRLVKLQGLISILQRMPLPIKHGIPLIKAEDAF
jgi:hypothetical protein